MESQISKLKFESPRTDLDSVSVRGAKTRPRPHDKNPSSQYLKRQTQEIWFLEKGKSRSNRSENIRKVEFYYRITPISTGVMAFSQKTERLVCQTQCTVGRQARAP